MTKAVCVTIFHTRLSQSLIVRWSFCCLKCKHMVLYSVFTVSDFRFRSKILFTVTCLEPAVTKISSDIRAIYRSYIDLTCVYRFDRRIYRFRRAESTATIHTLIGKKTDQQILFFHGENWFWKKSKLFDIFWNFLQALRFD